MTDHSSPGDLFEPSAEMMVNDFDDERTLDEEEAMEEYMERKNELSELQKEKDMPLETLLAMYGYNEDQEECNDGAQSSASEEALPNQELSPVKEEHKGETINEDKNDSEMVDVDIKEEEMKEDSVTPEQEMQQEEVEEEKEPSSMLHELYKDDPTVVPERNLRSGGTQRNSDEEEEEEEDYDYTPDEDDWKKTIMVGSDYQAQIPEGLCKYDDALPYENEDKLLWDPYNCNYSDQELEEYLVQSRSIHQSDEKSIQNMPRGSHVRDDEKALFVMLQCGYNGEEALRRQKMNSQTSSDTMSMWSEEECRNFELGLRQFGKDFHMIQQNKVRTRSVSELVQFYYLWKKTERHDVFANKARLEKKKYTLHPGTTDFMERFLDEQDSPMSSPAFQSLIAGDPKRQLNSMPAYFPSHNYSNSLNAHHIEEEITIDEARVISNHFQDISRHLDKEDYETLCRLARRHEGSLFPSSVSGPTNHTASNLSSGLVPNSNMTHHSNGSSNLVSSGRDHYTHSKSDPLLSAQSTQ